MQKAVLLEEIRVKRKTFWRSLLNGFASIGEGLSHIAGSFAPRETWRYEDHFGTDEEQIARDWHAVGEDLGRAIEEEQNGEEPQ